MWKLWMVSLATWLGHSKYSIPRLKEHVGKDLCWPVVVSNKTGTYALTVCPCKGKPGHDVKGALHQVDPVKKGEFFTTCKHFRLKLGDVGYRKNQGNGQP